MHIVTTGPRDCRPSPLIGNLIEYLRRAVGPDLVVIQGGARGSDSHVKETCDALGVACETEPADWDGPCDIEGGWCRPGHRRLSAFGWFCPAAGLRRNQLMLDKWLPKLVIAVLDRPLWTRGTRDMFDRSRSAGCAVAEFDMSLGLPEAIAKVEVELRPLLLAS